MTNQVARLGFVGLGLGLLGPALLTACSSKPTRAPEAGRESAITRVYRNGESTSYAMTFTDAATGRPDARFSVQVESRTRQDADGHFVEDISFADLVYNGKPEALPQGDEAPRFPVSLDPRNPIARFPERLSSFSREVFPAIGDLINFYADEWLAIKSGSLRAPGDHVLVPRPVANTWTPGTSLLLGEDCIDFDITLKSVDPAANRAVLVVQHVPPAKECVRLPAGWMHKPVAAGPNNWVELEKLANGRYRAEVGHETFTVTLTLELATGRMTEVTLDNPVDSIERVCRDKALTLCGPLRRKHELHRNTMTAVDAVR